MDKVKVRIVLAEEGSIGGVVRNPGHVLLEGMCPEGIAAADIDKAIQLKQVKVVSKNPAEEGKAKKDKDKTEGAK